MAPCLSEKPVIPLDSFSLEGCAYVGAEQAVNKIAKPVRIKLSPLLLYQLQDVARSANKAKGSARVSICFFLVRNRMLIAPNQQLSTGKDALASALQNMLNQQHIRPASGTSKCTAGSC